MDAKRDVSEGGPLKTSDRLRQRRKGFGHGTFLYYKPAIRKKDKSKRRTAASQIAKMLRPRDRPNPMPHLDPVGKNLRRSTRTRKISFNLEDYETESSRTDDALMAPIYQFRSRSKFEDNASHDEFPIYPRERKMLNSKILPQHDNAVERKNSASHDELPIYPRERKMLNSKILPQHDNASHDEMSAYASSRKMLNSKNASPDQCPPKAHQSDSPSLLEEFLTEANVSTPSFRSKLYSVLAQMESQILALLGCDLNRRLAAVEARMLRLESFEDRLIGAELRYNELSGFERRIVDMEHRQNLLEDDIHRLTRSAGSSNEIARMIELVHSGEEKIRSGQEDLRAARDLGWQAHHAHTPH